MLTRPHLSQLTRLGTTSVLVVALVLTGCGSSTATKTSQTSAVPSAVTTGSAPSTTSTPIAGLVVAPATPTEGSGGRFIVGDGDHFFSAYVAAGKLEIGTSTDGVTWQTTSSVTSLSVVEALAADGSTLVVSGPGSDPSNKLMVLRSDDTGATWRQSAVAMPTAPTFRYASWEANVGRVAISHGIVLVTGVLHLNVDWSSYTKDTLGADHGSVHGMGWDGMTITVTFVDGFKISRNSADLGLTPTDLDPVGAVWRGEDGVWERISPLADPSLLGLPPAIATGPGGFGLVAQAPPSATSPEVRYQLLRSVDGRSWSPTPLPDGLAGSGNVRLAGGANGFLAVDESTWFHSPDGTVWTQVTGTQPGQIITLVSAPVGGGRGYAVPALGPGSGSVWWSFDGKIWESAGLPLNTQDVAVAVSSSLILIEPRVPGLMPAPHQALPSDPVAFAQAVASAFYRSEVPTNPNGSTFVWRPAVTEPEASCIASGLITKLGEARVRDLGIGSSVWHLLGFALSHELAKGEAATIVGVFRSCSRTWELLMILGVTQGTNFISQSSAECTRKKLNDSTAQDIFIKELERTSVGLGHVQPLQVALKKCLTDQELQALDWN
jgi:hypothetical protein